MRILSSSLAVVLAAALAGCSGGSKNSTVSVSTAVKSGTQSLSSVTTPSGTARLDNLYLVVKEVELARGSTGTTGPTGPSGPMDDDGPGGASGHDAEELEAGPVVLEVAVTDSGLQAAIPTTVVPAGNYAGVELEIHRVRSTETLNLRTTKGGVALDGLSIVLEGTCTGPATGNPPVAPPPTAFAITSSMEVELEYESPFTIAEGASTNVTLAFDASRWLAGPGGTTLDPCAGDPTVDAQIMANVRSSLRAFDDDDRDGEED